MCFEFESIENCGVVTGSDHDTAGSLVCFHGKGDGGGWRGPGSEQNLKFVARENLGCAPGELIGKKAAIVTDDESSFRVAGRSGAPMDGRGLGDALKILKIEIFGDNRPPAVGAEFDLSHATREGTTLLDEQQMFSEAMSDGTDTTSGFLVHPTAGLAALLTRARIFSTARPSWR